MNLARRTWLARLAGLAFGAPALAAVLAACATAPGGSRDRIVDVRTGRHLQPDELAHRMRQADVVLLGELHDNPHHHARRAALLAALAGPRMVVAEHLPRGASPRLPGSPAGDALRRALETAGFDARAWGWPLHEPLFAAVARAGHRLQGGNIDGATARRIAREGRSAVPAELRSLLEAAPLDAAARAGLESELLRGHCGHLGPERMPGMVEAQRARDAAMAVTILAAIDAPRDASAGASDGPVLLLAGNGHVRLDHGVPQLLRSVRAGLRLLSIGFLEPGTGETPGLPYDVAWITPAAEREDPCKAFAAPRPAQPRPN